jgi:Zn-dependent peptidase ImmA (M78 family)
LPLLATGICFRSERPVELSDDRNSTGRKRIEQLANNFAAALLMPRREIQRLVQVEGRSDVANLREAASILGVSYQALAWRLSNLKLIDEATFRRLEQSHQPTSSRPVPKPYSLPFVEMLHEAIDKGRVSARKAAKALRLNLDQLGGLFVEHGLTTPFEL